MPAIAQHRGIWYPFFSQLVDNLHKMTASASLMNFFLVSVSFRKSDGGEMISKSFLDSNRCRTCNPVVPASPSINTLNLFSALSCVKNDDVDADVDDKGTNAVVVVGTRRIHEMIADDDRIFIV